MHVVVTGASSGIGAALARRFAALADARLTLVARRVDALRALGQELERSTGVAVHVVQRDLSDPAQMDDWLDEAERVQGPVDVLINNAGSQLVAPSESVDVELGEQSLRLNLVAPLRLARRVLPAMIARRSGTIVNVASMAALAPTPAMTYYNASKAGLAAASEALRGELAHKGVNVITVYPGIIDETDLAQAALAKYADSRALALQPRGTASELARRTLSAVTHRSARVIYPRSNALARWFPTITRWLMDRFAPPLRSEPLPALELGGRT